jgi:hypothetical protein
MVGFGPRLRPGGERPDDLTGGEPGLAGCGWGDITGELSNSVIECQKSN